MFKRLFERKTSKKFNKNKSSINDYKIQELLNSIEELRRIISNQSREIYELKKQLEAMLIQEEEVKKVEEIIEEPLDTYTTKLQELLGVDLVATLQDAVRNNPEYTVINKSISVLDQNRVIFFLASYSNKVIQNKIDNLDKGMLNHLLDLIERDNEDFNRALNAAINEIINENEFDIPSNIKEAIKYS